MRRSSVVVAVLAMLLMATPGSAVAADRSSSGGGAAPSKQRVGNGHTKKQPLLVEKWLRNKQAAADLVARGRAAPDENGIVTLKNGTPRAVRACRAPST